MGFYGEIINTGESPFTFDKIYSSRYHMEQAMAEDGIYSGRFVLVSYDSSYMHNDFKRAYIKPEDEGKTSNIILYKDATCQQPVIYKDFDDEAETLGDSMASEKTDIYYVQTLYNYTYYKCVDKDSNNIALFDYYTEMNSLYHEAFRDDVNETGSQIRLFLDAEHENLIKRKSVDPENGVDLGDIVFVHEKSFEQSEKEKAEGVFLYYECVGFEAGENEYAQAIALFELITHTVGYFQDETLENYIMNQKLDTIYFGNEGGIHNYDKTVWQKVYIGEKEKYIKVASLNSEVPKINLSLDAPEPTVSTSPYFDTDFNGRVEDLHIQPQWGLRIAAANKALSTSGMIKNHETDEWLSYIDYIKNTNKDFCDSYINKETSRIQLINDQTNILTHDFTDFLSLTETDSANTNLASLLDILNGDEATIISNINNYLNIQNDDITYPEYIKDFGIEQDENKEYFIKDENNNFITLEEYITSHTSLDNEPTSETEDELEPEVEEEILEYTPGQFYYKLNVENTNPIKQCLNNYNEYFIQENVEVIIDNNSVGFIDNERYYNEDLFEFENYIIMQDYYNLLLNNCENFDTINLETIFSFFDQFIISLQTYSNILQSININHNELVTLLLWEKSFNIRNELNKIFKFSFEKDIALSDEEESEYAPETIQFIYTSKQNILTKDNSEEIQSTMLAETLEIIEEYGNIESDFDIQWSAYKDTNALSYFNGYNWQDSEGTLPGAIYFNKAGFNPDVNVKSESTDYITLNPTGFSQIYDQGTDTWRNKEYTNKNSDRFNEKIESPDVQELSIHLPSVGNAVSTMWDVVYGEGEEDEDGNIVRKTSIDWDMTDEDYNDRVRLIQDGEEGGYEYNPNDVSSLAGAINTVQDLIGRIIVNDYNDFTSIEDEELTSDIIKNNLSKNNIYYFSEDQKFYSIKDKYNLDLDTYLNRYEQITLTDTTYQPNKYYTTDNNIDYILSTNDDFDSTKIYYADKLEVIRNKEDYYEKVQGYHKVDELTDPNNMPERFFYQDANNPIYIYEKTYINGENYVEFEPKLAEFGQAEGRDEYTLDSDGNLIKTLEYNWNGVDYYDLKDKIIGPAYLFVPGEFYINNPEYATNPDTDPYIAAETFNEALDYWVYRVTRKAGQNPITGETIPAEGEWIQVYAPKPEEGVEDLHPELHTPLLTINAGQAEDTTKVYNCFIKGNIDITTLSNYFSSAEFSQETFDTDVEENCYRKLLSEVTASIEFNIAPATSTSNNDKIFYGVLDTEFDTPLIKYAPNTYYCKEPESPAPGQKYYYYLSTDVLGDPNKQYFTLENIKNKELTLYKPSEYYIKIEDEAHPGQYTYLTAAGDFNDSTTYYKHNTFYVTQDCLGIYHKGQVWDYTLPWADYILDNSDTIGIYQDAETKTYKTKKYFYDSKGIHPVNMVADFDSSKYYTIENNYDYDNSPIRVENRTYFYPQTPGSEEPGNEVIFYEPNVYFGIDNQTSYFNKSEESVPARKAYYYNAADTNPVYFQDTTNHAIDKEFSKEIAKGTYYIYNYNNYFEEVKSNSPQVQNRTYQEGTTYYYDNQGEEKVYFEHLWNTYRTNGEKFYILNFEQDQNSSITNNRHYYKWDKTPAYLVEQFNNYYTQLVIDNPTYNTRIRATSYTAGIDYYSTQTGNSLIQYWDDEFNTYRDRIYMEDNGEYVLASGTNYDASKIYYSDALGISSITIFNKTTDTYYYYDTRQYIAANNIYNSNIVYRWNTNHEIVQIYPYTPGIFYFYNDETHKDNSNYEYIEQIDYDTTKQYYVSYPTNWTPGQNLKSIHFINKDDFPGNNTYFIIDNEDANRQRYLPVSTGSTYNSSNIYYEKVGNAYIQRIFEIWKPGVFYYQLINDPTDTQFYDIDSRLIPVTICTEPELIDNKAYYKDYLRTQPITLAKYTQGTFLYNNIENPTYIKLANNVDYDPYSFYYIKLESTDKTNIYTDTSDNKYKTIVLDGIEYDITEYEFDYADNINKLTPIAVDSRTNNKYLLQKIENWTPGKFYFENSYGELINICNLVDEEKLDTIGYFDELKSFSRKYNTINGLILAFNQALGDNTSETRDVKTLYGCINKLNDEINRLQMYDSAAIETITRAIESSYQRAVSISTELQSLRDQTGEAYDSLLSEQEAYTHYTNARDFNKIIGYDLKTDGEGARNIEPMNPDPALNTGFLKTPIIDLNIEGFKNKNNSIIQEISDINKRTAESSKLIELFGIENVGETELDFNTITTAQLNLPEIQEENSDGTFTTVKPNVKQSIDYLTDSLNDLKMSVYGHGDNQEDVYDLTNTTWTFNEIIDAKNLYDSTYNVTISSRDVTYNSIIVTSLSINYGSQLVYNTSDGLLSNRKEFTITGGEDVHSTELYQWLMKVATTNNTITPQRVQLTDYFGPGSKLIDQLESYNEKGLLARISALDLNLNTLDETYESLRTSIAEMRDSWKSKVAPTVVGTTVSTGTSEEGSGAQADDKNVSKKLTLSLASNLDTSYGFRYAYDNFWWEQKGTMGNLSYEVKFYFTPTANKSFKDVEFINIKEFNEGLSFSQTSHYLTIKADNNMSPNLDAYITWDGKIYLTCVDQMTQVSPGMAYEYTLAGFIQDNAYGEDGKLKVKQQLQIFFGNDKGELAKNANFTTSSQTITLEDGSFFNVPQGPTPPAGLTFSHWLLCDNSSSKTPVKDQNGQQIILKLQGNTQIRYGDAEDSTFNRMLNDAKTGFRGNYFVPIYTNTSGREIYIIHGSYFNLAAGISCQSFASNTAFKLFEQLNGKKRYASGKRKYVVCASGTGYASISGKTSVKINGSKRSRYKVTSCIGGKTVTSTGTQLKTLCSKITDNSNSNCTYYSGTNASKSIKATWCIQS